MKNFWKISAVILVVVGVISALTFAIINNDKYRDVRYGIAEPSSDNGNIGDHVKGSSDAKVIVFEYADFQCSACASMNTKINKAVEALNGQVAVVYRNYILSYHQNGTAAASAAEAAGLQGYWKAYGDKLFERQDEWFYDDAAARVKHFTQYFEEVTNGEGDVDKFIDDMSSKNVSRKIKFDMAIGNQIEIPGTPALFIDGQFISWSTAGSVIVNGKKIAWDSSRGTESGILELFTEFLNAKLGE